MFQRHLCTILVSCILRNAQPRFGWIGIEEQTTGMAFNPYRLLRPVLFRIDPEKAHHLTIKLLKKGLAPRFKNDIDPILHTSLCGLSFLNPIGLAAGFDKQAEVMEEMLGFGFGSVEVGSITPQPQPGNPKPRLFRIPEASAVINR